MMRHTIQITTEPTLPILTANDLKTGGISAVEAALSSQPEAIISVRGKQRFVVMEVAQYHYLRECELDAALAQSQADLAAGRYVVESAQAHAERMEAMLAATEPPAAPPLPPSARKRAKSSTSVVKKPANSRRQA